MVATVFVRREEPGGDAIVPLSGGTVDGLLQPFTGRRAEAQAGGVTGGDGESPEPNRQRSGAPQAEAVDGDGDCFEGRPSAGALQDGQTLPAHDRGWQVELVTAGGDDCPGSAAGWDLCDSHQRDGGTIVGRRCGAWLQESGAGGTGLPQFEKPGSVDSSHSSSHGRSRAGAYFPLPAGLLCGMASAPRVGTAAVCRRGTTQPAVTARSGSAGSQLGIRSSQETHAPDSRRITRTELGHAAFGLGQSLACDL